MSKKQSILSKLNKVEERLEISKDLPKYEYAELQMKLYIYKFAIQTIFLDRWEQKRNEKFRQEYFSDKKDENHEQLQARKEKINKRLGVLAVQRQKINQSYEAYQSKINDIAEDAMLSLNKHEKEEKAKIIDGYSQYVFNTNEVTN